jgi:Domain of unknown function (DUF4189)
MTAFILMLGFIFAAGAFLAPGTARAEGAFAIGDCSAYGYAINFDSVSEARRQALAECRSHRGKNCKVVVTLHGNCGAFATDRSRSCGAWGWATRATRSLAEDAAVSQCSSAGGRRCSVRTHFCDTKSASAEPSSPALTTNWTSTTLGQNECLDRASRIVKEAGLTTNFERVGQSVFGEQGDYTAQVRCISEKGVVVFVIIGPKLDRARVHMKALIDNF